MCDKKITRQKKKSGLMPEQNASTQKLHQYSAVRPSDGASFGLRVEGYLRARCKFAGVHAILQLCIRLWRAQRHVVHFVPRGISVAPRTAAVVGVLSSSHQECRQLSLHFRVVRVVALTVAAHLMPFGFEHCS